LAALLQAEEVHSEESLRELRQLYHLIVYGMRNVFTSLANCRQGPNKRLVPFEDDEILLLSKYFQFGLKGLRLFWTPIKVPYGRLEDVLGLS